ADRRHTGSARGREPPRDVQRGRHEPERAGRGVPGAPRGARVCAGCVQARAHGRRERPHRVHAQAEEPRARRISDGARVGAVPAPVVQLVRAADRPVAALRHRAAGRRDDRGPSGMPRRKNGLLFPPLLRGALAIVLLGLAAAPVVAQILPPELDPSRAVRGLQEELPRPAAEPPMPAPPQTTDAAALLGAGEAPDGALPMFGEQLFRGVPQAFGVGFNPDYTLAIGDRVTLRMWGAFTYEAVQVIDPQGNVFIPNVGPVRLAGVRNEDLNAVVQSAVRQVYRNNVDVYASLEA